jgi:hypothetical protein
MMETAVELVYHEVELVELATRAVDGLEERSTPMAGHDPEGNWNRRYGTAKGGDEE